MSNGKQATPIKAHKRGDVAVAASVQLREKGRGRQPATQKFSGKQKTNISQVASAQIYEMDALQWRDIIQKRDEVGPPDPQEAYFQDGTLHVGKRKLMISATRTFTYLHDDPETQLVEEHPHDVPSRDLYEIDVPEGVHVNYEKIREAFALLTEDKFANFVKNNVYGDVDLESVVVQEWEVVPADKPEKVWSLQRELWEENVLDYESRRKGVKK